MKKKTLISTLIASGIWVVMACVYLPLVFSGKFEVDTGRILSFFFAIVALWIPYALLWCRVKFDLTTVIIYQVFIYLSSIVGTAWKVYLYVDFYDIIVHSLSGVLIGFIAYDIIRNNSKARLEYLWLFVFILGVTMLAGGVWEIYEFTGDTIVGSNMQVWQNLEGHSVLNDTMIDLVCDFCGGLISATACLFIEHKKRKTEVSSNSNGE
jgi:hypothetical protein